MTNDTFKKKRGRSKGFRSCFRSSGAGDRSFLSEKSDDGDSKSERLGTPVLIAVSDRKGEHFISDVNSVNGDDCYDKRSSSSSRRRFTRVLKAVLFDTAMSKKIRGRSCLKSSMASNASLSSFSSEKTGKEACSDIDDSASRRSYLSSSMTPSSVVSTSSSSSVASNPRSLPDQSTEFRHPVTSNWLSSTKPKHISFNPRSGVKSHLRDQDSVSSVKSKSIKSKQKRSSLKGSPDLRNPVLSNVKP